ncbi:MAG: response regulator, partial [Alphaproteobacteria bacterium]|nr:response regulator [Alphaproteobacteria bacterium]
VTDLKNSETRATEARAKLVAAMESMAGGIAFFDANERLELCNESFKWFMNNDPLICSPGVTLEAAHRQGALRLAPEIREKAVEDALRRHRAGQSVLIPFGDNRWARLLMRYTGDGRATLLATDVTEQRQRQRELERALDAAEAARAESDAANQAKSTFLATMSHEIRTPMNGVLGMIEVLGREKLDDEQRDLVQTMRDSAGTVLRLLDDLLDFSKIEAGRTELEQVAFSLSSVVERAADNFRSAAAAKGISVSVAMSPGSADALIGDPTRVRQIVANLIGNAVKFTERGAVIVRALTQPLGEGRTEIEISVSDTGIGMDEMQLAGLFKPFAQADSGTTRRYGGTGLGLSIVRRLAQLMDGDVTVQSAPGAGSTFIATLVLQAAPADSPLVELQAQAGPAASGAPVAPAVSSRARVLVVDDHPVNLKVALRQLASLGVAADTAANGRDGLERWRAGDYALVLADVHMPDMDGFEMTALIRAEESRRGLPRTPIVASTANALKGEDERCRAAGMDGYLAKPVETDRLRAVIERWLPSADQSAVRADVEPVHDTDDGVILDRSVLYRWSGGDAAFERDLLDTFAGELDQSERDIDAAMQAGDLARVAQAAHRLKGSALQIGARRAGAAALALEEAGKAADRQRCQDARGRLAIELRRLTVVLQSAAPQSVGGTNM